MLPARSLRIAQFVPNWKLITMPLTTPMPKLTAKIFSQNLYSSSHIPSRVRSQRHSRKASQLARPMVKAGKRMWNEMTNPNWIRESSRASTQCLRGTRGRRRAA